MTDNTMTKRFPLSGPIKLHLRLGHGSVTVETQDDLTEASVHIEAGQHAGELLSQTVVDMRGDTLVINAPRQGGLFDLLSGWRAGRGLDARVLIPSGTPVKISTFTAPIQILGRVGDADLAFGSAEAGVRHVDGALRLRYGSGTAKAGHVTGSVQVRSGSGNAEFGEIDGDLVAGCGSGDIRVRIVHGDVRSRCGSGNARLGEVHGDVDLASGSGGLEIGLPAGVSAQLDVTTGSGQVHSDLPIEDSPNKANESIRVRARTGSGDVRLFRAA